VESAGNKLLRLMLGDVDSLALAKPIESLTISVDYGQGVSDFLQPKVEIGDLTSQLMRIEADEFRQLIRQMLGDYRGIALGGKPLSSLESDLAL
jgi:hypothetical protein